MLNQTTYYCNICNVSSDQISHHKSHLKTQKHNDKKELFELKLSLESDDNLINTYYTTDINSIVQANENIKKKLNNLNNNNYTTMTSITNKDALKDKIHEIHNYLRNNGAGYGMSALKVFNVFYGLKKIEETPGCVEKLGLADECKFSYLLDCANSADDTEMVNKVDNMLDSIGSSTGDIKNLLYYDIPRTIKGSVLAEIIKEINEIIKIEESCNVLLSGKIYEYFIGRDASAITELGAYFTDRHIVDFILEKLNPVKNDDGSIPTMIDMFGGSGGFTTGYINYMKDKYKDDIQWNDEINKIFHFDMNEDVVRSAALEFFCLTGEIPDMVENVAYKNSFTHEFGNKKYKYPITNPPYGGDSNKKTDIQIKRIKVTEYIKNKLKELDNGISKLKKDELLKICDTKNIQYKKSINITNILKLLGYKNKNQDKIDSYNKQLGLINIEDSKDKLEKEKNNVNLTSCSVRINKFANIHKLSATDKEACSLILLMDIVDHGGTAIGVLKEGVLFDSCYSQLRKCLIKNFNIKEIICIPSDQFENTSTTTSIIIFENCENKTTNIKFSQLVINKYEMDKFEEVDGMVVLIENGPYGKKKSGDIRSIHAQFIIDIGVSDLLDNPNYSLHSKDYSNTIPNVRDGYTCFKIKDLCKININVNKMTKHEYNLVQIKNIDNNSIKTNTKLCKKDELPTNATNIVKRCDILISSVRPKANKVVYIDSDHINNINITDYVFTTPLIKLESNDINKSNFIYLMLLNLADELEDKICKASQYPKFKGDDLGNLYIPIPNDTQSMTEWCSRINNADNNELVNKLMTDLKNDIYV